MDPRFQIPMQYCSLEHWTSLSPPDTSPSECHFCFSPATSFFLKLLVIALCSSPVAYWTLSCLGGFSSGIIFLPFYTVHGVLEVRLLEWLPFPPPVDCVLSELSTMTHPSWVALHSMTHSFIELHKPLPKTRL